MKTYDRRGWVKLTMKAMEAHIYRRGNVGMLVQFEDFDCEPKSVEYFVWGMSDVRYGSYAEALVATRKVWQTDSSEAVH